MRIVCTPLGPAGPFFPMQLGHRNTLMGTGRGHVRSQFGLKRPTEADWDSMSRTPQEWEALRFGQFVDAYMLKALKEHPGTKAWELKMDMQLLYGDDESRWPSGDLAEISRLEGLAGYKIELPPRWPNRAKVDLEGLLLREGIARAE